MRSGSRSAADKLISKEKRKYVMNEHRYALLAVLVRCSRTPGVLVLGPLPGKKFNTAGDTLISNLAALYTDNNY